VLCAESAQLVAEMCSVCVCVCDVVLATLTRCAAQVATSAMLDGWRKVKTLLSFLCNCVAQISVAVVLAKSWQANTKFQ
jgi:hypothetical protein